MKRKGNESTVNSKGVFFFFRFLMYFTCAHGYPALLSYSNGWKPGRRHKRA